MRTTAAAFLLSLAAASAFAGEPAVYGVPFDDGEAMPVSEAITGFKQTAGEPRLFSGRIAEVCQAKGCWLMLEDDGQLARVMFGDHAFFIPRDSSGRAVVHGVLERKELTPEQLDHLRGDSGAGLAVDPVEYRIVADGVRIQG